MTRLASLSARLRHGAVLLGAVATIGSGCEHMTGSSAADDGAGQTASGDRTAFGFAQFPDIAVPAGSRMDLDRTLVFGAREEWIGRLTMNSGATATYVYDFFLREMPRFGWREITTMRSEVSVLTYDRGDRVATVQVQKRSLGGSRIDIMVSPRGRPPAFPAAAVTTGTPR